MRVIRAAEYHRMPWQNGGGETMEIAIGPPGAVLDRFDWRISLARIDSDGPFSIFPGIDRTLSVVSGAGLKLAIDTNAAVPLMPGSEPFTFSGDAAVRSSLIAGSVTDLNVMTRRGFFRHRVTKFIAESGWHRCKSDSDHPDAHTVITLIFSADGTLRVACGSESVQIEPCDSLMLSEPLGSVSFSSQGVSRVLLIEIGALPATSRRRATVK